MGDRVSADEARGFVAVARAHREHERYHSMLKLDDATAWRRDSNVLKVLADHWTTLDGGGTGTPDPAYGAVGCPDLNGPAVVATTGVLFMEGPAEPAELAAMVGRFDEAAGRYRRLAEWLAGHMAAEWPRLSVLLAPQTADAARPRFAALARTTAAGQAYDLVAHLLTTAVTGLRGLDLSPAGVRDDPDGAAAVLRNASWLVDMASARLAEAAAQLSLSDPDWTAFTEELYCGEAG
ncbi:hypothetical protein [Actinomadura oligospora]|uniref:hypothetical protein n=1 Tax=Actinomadura oligospora TaxID=111804 RepID=UPI00047A9626|nr:hypothetical protein [Actinomadura oligospora]